MPFAVACGREATPPEVPRNVRESGRESGRDSSENPATPRPLSAEERAGHASFRAAYDQVRAAAAAARGRRPDRVEAAADFVEALIAEDPEAIGVTLERLLRSLPPQREDVPPPATPLSER